MRLNFDSLSVMKARVAVSSTIFITFFAIGLWFTFSTNIFPRQNEFSMSSPSSVPSREPSAIRPMYDFSNLEGSALHAASTQRLMSGFHVLHDKNNVGIELGHFVLRGPGGAKQFACDHFSKVTLTLQGEGMAVGGEKPEMQVAGPCEISSDINSMAPLWIPTDRILQEPVGEGEFEFNDHQQLRVSFKNVSDTWPTLWKVKSIRLSTKDAADGDVLVDEQDLNQSGTKPVFVSFK